MSTGKQLEVRLHLLASTKFCTNVARTHTHTHANDLLNAIRNTASMRTWRECLNRRFSRCFRHAFILHISIGYRHRVLIPTEANKKVAAASPDSVEAAEAQIELEAATNLARAIGVST